MPRYMFDIEDHVLDLDDEGQELAGPAEARIQAIIYAGAILRDDPDLVWDGRELKVRVHEEGGPVIVTIHVHAVDTPAG